MDATLLLTYICMQRRLLVMWHHAAHAYDHDCHHYGSVLMQL